MVEEMEDELTQAKNLGTEASGGVLEEVELINFMCHKYFSMKLGPQINFVTGPNGSADHPPLFPPLFFLLFHGLEVS